MLERMPSLRNKLYSKNALGSKKSNTKKVVKLKSKGKKGTK